MLTKKKVKSRLQMLFFASAIFFAGFLIGNNRSKIIDFSISDSFITIFFSKPEIFMEKVINYAPIMSTLLTVIIFTLVSFAIIKILTIFLSLFRRKSWKPIVISNDRNGNRKVRKAFVPISRKRQTINEVKDEIVNVLKSNPNSLNFMKNTFKKTGNLDHDFLNSIKEKVKSEIEARMNIREINGINIDRYIENEVKRKIRKY
ncbi:hypothetical protein ACFFF5_12900 [Lederbergia wuyishanensis]|uniref:ATP synthase protein MI25 n=1 Tax=Lederbergia wuyishanensis TaxID=1347903 RepID=A0ABU0D808_9BACI|nr:hypothetical protein [Lederbergia wuyishanensis]MCJ8009308.1 hypothetical protein [Lederbergia wuyishanensis]MDQ0344558.1 hypothetical protein [Lederbergia wuyishanensis]